MANAAESRFGPSGGVLQLNEASMGRGIACFPVTTASQDFDPTSATYFGGTAWQSRFVRLICATPLYYYWSNNAADTVTETATGATTQTQQCDLLPGNETREELPGGLYLHVKGTAADILRISIVDRPAS